MTAEPARPPRRRRPTATSAFGVGRRESHDASGFYERFQAPAISSDATVARPKLVDEILLGDSRELLASDKYVRDNSVALMVTSPPYYAGKAYEAELGTGHVPGTYKDYLQMLEDVFAAVVPKLEPGGRIAVNVANLGRKPYRSLASDVIFILQERLRLLLRGEIVWQKAIGATGSVAWGSFQSPQNPVLRDVTERIIVASKGRFDRALDRDERARRGLPHQVTIDADQFMDATIDLWEMPPESATRVGHPAPFPVALPQTLIELYTYESDLVLDPFMGSGTTAVAAIRSHRHYIGMDTDADYVAAAGERCAAELAERTERERAGTLRVQLPPKPAPADPDEAPQARAAKEGRKAKEIAAILLEQCGFTIVEADRKLFTGVTIDFAAVDKANKEWYFDVSGAFTSVRSGLRRSDAVWKALGKAALTDEKIPYVLLTSDRPGRTSAAERALKVARERGIVFDALELFQPSTVERLGQYAAGGQTTNPPKRLFGE